MTTKTITLLGDSIRRTELDNGIRIVTERMPFVHSVALGVWIQAGSSYESPENNGIAHFLEHMLFKGTTNRSAKEIAQSLESLGGGLNASTGKEVSFYSAHVLGEHIDIVVDVLSDMLHNSLFEAQDIELEKQVVLAEMAHTLDDPEELVFDHFFKNLFPKHPLGYFIYGPEENIHRFTKNDLQSFLKKNYTPARTVISAAGSVDHDQLISLVQNSNFAYSKNHTNVGSHIPLPDIERETIVRSRGLQQAHICLGARTFGYSDRRRYALALLDIMFGSGMGSRLFQNIREKYGFAYSVFSFAELMSATGVFGAYIGCDKSKINESIRLLKLELEKIKNGDITDLELQQAKSQLRGNLIIGLESSGRRMRQNGETEIYCRKHRSIAEIIDLVDSVSKNDVEELVQELFTLTNTSITILSP